MPALFALAEAVAAIDDVPEENVRHGEIGTIVHIYELPGGVEAYDVAFLGADGTSREVTLSVRQLERVVRVERPADDERSPKGRRR